MRLFRHALLLGKRDNPRGSTANNVGATRQSTAPSRFNFAHAVYDKPRTSKPASDQDNFVGNTITRMHPKSFVRRRFSLLAYQRPLPTPWAVSSVKACRLPLAIRMRFLGGKWASLPSAPVSRRGWAQRSATPKPAALRLNLASRPKAPTRPLRSTPPSTVSPLKVYCSPLLPR